DQVVDEVVEEPRDGRELEPLGDEERGPDQDDADDHLGGAGALDRQQEAVDQVVDQRDVGDRDDDGACAQVTEPPAHGIDEGRAHGPLISKYTTSAARSNPGSWTRSTFAPAATPARHAPRVAASRSRVSFGSHPASRATNRLRDGPRTTAAP